LYRSDTYRIEIQKDTDMILKILHSRDTKYKFVSLSICIVSNREIRIVNRKILTFMIRRYNFLISAHKIQSLTLWTVNIQWIQWNERLSSIFYIKSPHLLLPCWVHKNLQALLRLIVSKKQTERYKLPNVRRLATLHGIPDQTEKIRILIYSNKN
jgi:hypothetical protein